MIWKGRKSLGTLKKHLFSLGWFCSDWCGLNGGHSLFTDDRRRNHVGMAGQSDLQDFSRPKKGQRSRRSSRSGRQFQALQITKKKTFFPFAKKCFQKVPSPSPTNQFLFLYQLKLKYNLNSNVIVVKDVISLCRQEDLY